MELPRLYTIKHQKTIVGRIITNCTKKTILKELIPEINDEQLIMTYEDLYHELKYQLLNNSYLMLEVKEQPFDFLGKRENYFFRILELEI